MRRSSARRRRTVLRPSSRASPRAVARAAFMAGPPNGAMSIAATSRYEALTYSPSHAIPPATAAYERKPRQDPTLCRPPRKTSTGLRRVTSVSSSAGRSTGGSIGSTPAGSNDRCPPASTPLKAATTSSTRRFGASTTSNEPRRPPASAASTVSVVVAPPRAAAVAAASAASAGNQARRRRIRLCSPPATASPVRAPPVPPDGMKATHRWRDHLVPRLGDHLPRVPRGLCRPAPGGIAARKAPPWLEPS